MNFGYKMCSENNYHQPCVDENCNILHENHSYQPGAPISYSVKKLHNEFKPTQYRLREYLLHGNKNYENQSPAQLVHQVTRTSYYNNANNSNYTNTPTNPQSSYLDDVNHHRELNMLHLQQDLLPPTNRPYKEREMAARYRSINRSPRPRQYDNNTSFSLRRDRYRKTILEKPKECLPQKNGSLAKLNAVAQRPEKLEFTPREVIQQDKNTSASTSPEDLYYVRDNENPKLVRSTNKLIELCKRFQEELVLRAATVNATKPHKVRSPLIKKHKLYKHASEQCSDFDTENEDLTNEGKKLILKELKRKQSHPDRLHTEMWYNEPGEMNDGPFCRCSLKSKKCGIQHEVYQGEKAIPKCDLDSNNATTLYHYRITFKAENFRTEIFTTINSGGNNFVFEGFSMFSHFPLKEFPKCKIKFYIEYTIDYIKDEYPEKFTIRELDLFYDYIFCELLEMVDLDFRPAGNVDSCPLFHFMPRFVRDVSDNGRKILPMNEVLQYLLESNKPLIDKKDLPKMMQMNQQKWRNQINKFRGMIVTYPGKKPCSVRIDALDRPTNTERANEQRYPEIIHLGVRPPQLRYAGKSDYYKAWRNFMRHRHLFACKSKQTVQDKAQLELKKNKLNEMRMKNTLTWNVTIAISAEGFQRTGLMCDVMQHAMLLPALVGHLRFHCSLKILEEHIQYKFKNRSLLQLALTHSSYGEPFGTNPDHARNSLINCGIRRPRHVDKRKHNLSKRKRGINTLFDIMSQFEKPEESEIKHNERLEFLGDAVVEFLCSIHLFGMFPDLEEGGLTTYRSSLVQREHLAHLAQDIHLEQFLLYAHGAELCCDLGMKHAIGNSFEALMGALFLDGGIETADKVFGRTIFKNNMLLEVWQSLPLHPLQKQEPSGDRHWIAKYPVLQKLTEFEDVTGIQFTHIRLLAKAFTDKNVGYTSLTLGSNQRLEFLGDAILQLLSSEYLYKHFPKHHEGHLTLLRSSLVNNNTQAEICDDLGLTNYAIYSTIKPKFKTKHKADLLEAFVGALYLDKDIEYCRTFFQATMFPRIRDFIINQDWNDPKSKLQQCLLTERSPEGGKPDLPVYKVIECKGPSNTRYFTVGVYFRGKRLATAGGSTIQQAEINSAKKALDERENWFPHLDYQKRFIAENVENENMITTKNNSSGSDDIHIPYRSPN